MPSVGKFEPHTALDGGEDGLLFYRALAEKAETLLAPHGIMAVECGFDQALQICELFSGKDMETIVLKDLAGIERVVAARKIGKMYNGFSNRQ
jgi:release factor glutamine methyltransferase